MKPERKPVRIRLQQLHLPITHTKVELRTKAAEKLGVSSDAILSLTILKQSLDARRNRELAYVYDVAAELSANCRPKGREGRDWTFYEPVVFQPKAGGSLPLTGRPVVIGAGPAGLFAALVLAEHGFRPVVIERGKAVAERVADVERFFATGVLDPESNVQFGVGGAGTFSDGKLNTLIKDRDGRGAYVLSTFVRFGAPEEILYRNKPHIGTDRLRDVVAGLQAEIERLGGTVLTETTVTGFEWQSGKLTGVICRGKNVDYGSLLELSTKHSDAYNMNDSENAAVFRYTIPASVAVLAIGHSARDTMRWLYDSGVSMEPKAFAMGVRVQHSREWLNRTQYGEAEGLLPSADYKLTHTCKDGRGVYSFCMCPGGYVVNASSERGRLAINGMSNFDRMADNSNSAIVVTVTPEDCASDYASVLAKRTFLAGVGEVDGITDTPELSEIPKPLVGMEYQRRLEELAFLAGKGAIPTQRYADFQAKRPSTGCGSITPVNKGAVRYTELHQCLPGYMTDAIEEGMEAFDRAMPGFGCGDVLMQAVESRTSSPVRITRGEDLQAAGFAGLYPCGEGAGYAGGIMSAAIDGIRVAEAIMGVYAPNERKQN